jgi:hypothetical protein
VDAADTSSTPRWRKVLISAFILWHLYCVGVFLMPPSILRDNLLIAIGVPSWKLTSGRRAERRWEIQNMSAIEQYLFVTGQWQNWDMFAPPMKQNQYLRSEIEYRDGTVFAYTFPRIQDIPFWAKNGYNQFRKFQVTMVHVRPDLLMDVGHYLARQYPGTDSNPVVRVRFYHEHFMIPTPEQEKPETLSWSEWLHSIPYTSRLVKVVRITEAQR